MKRYKILIVDDEEYILWSLERLLEDEYQVFTAQSGSEGLELLRMQPVDVIICDQRMPGIRGTEFFAHVSQLYPETVNLLITCLTNQEEIISALKHGWVDNCIEKVSKPTDLLAELKRACRICEQRKRELEFQPD